MAAVWEGIWAWSMEANGLETEYIGSLPNKMRPLLVKCVAEECTCRYGNCMCEMSYHKSPSQHIQRDREGVRERERERARDSGAVEVRDLHFAVEISFLSQSLYYYILVMLKKRSSIYFN